MTLSTPFRLAVFDQSVSAGGVRRFTLAMLASWLKLASPAELRVTLFWPAADTAGHALSLPFSAPPHLTVRAIPPGLPVGEGVAWLAPQSGEFDAIYFPSTVHMLRPDVDVRLAAPAIATLHDLAHEFTTAWGPLTPAVRLEMRQWAHFAQAVIFSSDYIRHEAARLYRLPTDRTHRVYLAPPLVAPTPPAAAQLAALRAKYGLPEQFLLSPGTAMVHKNPAVIIEAVGRLKQQGRAWPLALIGPLVEELVPGRRTPATSDYHLQLQRRIVELGLKPGRDVFLLGHLPDEELPAIYAACSAVVTASHSEAGLSGPVFEGMWYQKPVLCSAIPQFVERLGADDALACLFDPGDAEDLAQTLRRWEADPEASRQRVQRASEWVRSRTWDDAAREYLAIFRQTAEQHAPRAAELRAPAASPTPPPPPGFNVIGHISGNLGLGVLARNTVATLRARGCPVSVLDLDPGLGRGGHDRRFDAWAVDSAEALPHAINLFVLPSPAMPWALSALRAALRPGRLNAALIMWELTVLPPEWRAALECLDVIVAQSDFIRHVAEFNLSGVVTVSAAPPLDLPDGVQPDRARWGLPEDAVVFIASFEPYSDLNRKNIQAVIAAFRRALAREPRAHLVLKANNVQSDPALRSRVQDIVDRMSGRHPRVHLVAEDLSYADVLSLYAGADVYVSLHRAEGLGLGLMEAMALGKPVIATAWSGNLTYMDHTNACLVGRRLIPVDGAIPAYRKELLGDAAVWADPDIGEAAAWMSRLFHDPALRADLGRRAAESMLALQQRAARASFVDELTAIWEQRRAAPDVAARKAETLRRYLKAVGPVTEPAPVVPRQSPARQTAAARADARVDIVIPVYGQAALLSRCVESVLATTDAHLILVDDCSPGPEVQRLFAGWRGHPRITLARTPSNQGFIGASRLGASLGAAPFILFLNSDTQALEPGWLDRLIPAEAGVAITGARLVYPAAMPGPLAGALQHAGVARGPDGAPYHPFLGRPADLPEANVARDVNAVTGACLLVRRAVWEELGGWDPRFGKGVYEDVDLCWRARAQGYRVRYEPAACLVHAESASKAPDGRHPLNVHTRENLQKLLDKWGAPGSDEDLFFGQPTLQRWARARRQIQKASSALDQRNLKAAFAAVRKALEAAPDLPEVLIGYGQLLSQRGDHTRAAEHFEKAVQLSPTAWAARLRLVDEWLAARRPDKAAAELRQLRAVFPDAPEVRQRAEQLLPAEPAAAAPAASARAVETLQFLLAQPDLPAALQSNRDRLDADLVALVRLNADTARGDGNTELGELLDTLAAHITRLIDQPASPAEALLDALLSADDLPAALEAHADALDNDLVALVRADARAARADGDAELADGLEALAERVEMVIADRVASPAAD